ncbi:hypothetical protein GGF32_002811 [Allomyces javanicus]|nr:hypothetical protein GGF32_002811 [Allomyces javanicus]
MHFANLVRAENGIVELDNVWSWSKVTFGTHRAFGADLMLVIVLYPQPNLGRWLGYLLLDVPDPFLHHVALRTNQPDLLPTMSQLISMRGFHLRSLKLGMGGGFMSALDFDWNDCPLHQNGWMALAPVLPQLLTHLSSKWTGFLKSPHEPHLAHERPAHLPRDPVDGDMVLLCDALKDRLTQLELFKVSEFDFGMTDVNAAMLVSALTWPVQSLVVHMSGSSKAQGKAARLPGFCYTMSDVDSYPLLHSAVKERAAAVLERFQPLQPLWPLKSAGHT